jgi:hypothetical protein
MNVTIGNTLVFVDGAYTVIDGGRNAGKVSYAVNRIVAESAYYFLLTNSKACEVTITPIEYTLTGVSGHFACPKVFVSRCGSLRFQCLLLDDTGKVHTALVVSDSTNRILSVEAAT